MFLSIVIPVWNDEKYLNECLDSCLDQHLSKDEYEIICVDDGSTDRTPEILQDYAEHYPNIRILSKLHGWQYGSGRVIGYEASQGDYIWLVDHDDVVAPNAIDELKQAATEHPDFERIEFPCYKFYDALTEEERKLMKMEKLRQNFLFPPLDGYVWSSILKRSFLQENKILPSTHRRLEAAAFWETKTFPVWGGDWILIDKCKDYGARTFCLNRRPLYHYRVHSSSMTMVSSPEAIERRNEMRYNMALYRGYRAWVQKQKYLAERAENGSSSSEAAEKTVLKIRDAVNFLSMQSDDQWKAGIKRFAEKEIFLTKKPEEYPLTFRQYWKRLSKKEKLLPNVLAFYYSYTKRGAKLFWVLSWPLRFRKHNRLLSKVREKRVRKKVQTIGLTSWE